VTDVSAIRNGTYLGECLVHCDETVEVTPGAVHYTLTSRVPDARRPDIDVTEPLSAERWAALSASADARALADARAAARLPPDAADAGGEFVELVSPAGAVDRVTFATGAEVPRLEGLLSDLRALRAELARRHRA
jgi:hypothetical protein